MQQRQLLCTCEWDGNQVVRNRECPVHGDKNRKPPKHNYELMEIHLIDHETVRLLVQNGSKPEKIEGTIGHDGTIELDFGYYSIEKKVNEALIGEKLLKEREEAERKVEQDRIRRVETVKQLNACKEPEDVLKLACPSYCELPKKEGIT